MLQAISSGLSFIHYELASAEHAVDIFLWLQERSIFTRIFAHVAKPGVTLRAADLLRNLVLSEWTNDSVAEQTSKYVELWLPLDTKFATADAFDAFLAAFAAHLSASGEIEALTQAAGEDAAAHATVALDDMLYFALATWVRLSAVVHPSDTGIAEHIIARLSQAVADYAPLSGEVSASEQ
ncbi:uncharacterized protein AMSG_11823 [Thecamonas trahens ATCC 50062]|uniref:Uncharacterized protein n=1 Tax=Thecamonas trahens ATCC 50062 TaxID=461836 RepID=A0A0L0D823_THETB|nr:hypothetical protein AMSG_11823 [Thecamonas trahens ATCC 50062]KNC48355.1 hypothetical protein AMSG_11823 [Thecamonas trahens ATCC 50062]|eukprot:XP_013758658.1 hypothetical protein AMSG_11823 [Thecamonas trahens ATCC 50062]